jgi:TonB family protein
MRAGRIEGKVLLQAVIDEMGKVVDVEVLRSSQQEALDVAASDAVRQWRYKPAQKDGKAVKVLFTVVVHFSVAGDEPHEPV